MVEREVLGAGLEDFIDLFLSEGSGLFVCLGGLLARCVFLFFVSFLEIT
jgi:hypothetical protein